MQEKPEVTVLIPCYNMEFYLAEALKSVCCQTYANLEIIVVDDGSTDRTVDIARGFARGDPRIQVIAKSNGGASSARNHGLDHATGKYIALIDGDDYWDLTKIEKQVMQLEGDPGLGVSYCGTQFIRVDGKRLHRRLPKTGNINDMYLYCRNPITNGSTPVFRREVFEEHRFDETKARHNDVDCWMRIAFTPPRRWRFGGVDEVLTYYRITPGSLSDGLEEHYAACKHSWAKSFLYAPEIAARYARLAEAFQLRNYARRAFSSRRMRAARQFILSAIMTDPRVLYWEGGKTVVTLAAVMLPLPSKD